MANDTVSDNSRNWQEFRESGLLWWVNRILHTFGWAIFLEIKADGTVIDAYPSKTKFRGFSEQDEAEGYAAVAKTLAEMDG